MLLHRKITLGGLLLALVFLVASCGTNEDDAAVRALAKRLIPQYEKNFVFNVVADTVQYYELESVGKKVVIRGDCSNSVAVGLNRYLNDWCHTTVSWNADDPMEMPSVLPVIETPVRVESLTRNRFFLNYCTFGYTMPWWGWREWERFIDWMALNGVTMPLAITGQEAVWQKVWRAHGMSDEQIRSYFTGPAHLPWHRMSNIDKWEGPLPQEWIDSQAELQKKILQRERSLGMTPILPAFAGHVPAELAESHPDAKFSRVSYWGGFADEYRCTFLSPMDPLFAQIQKEFLDEQTAMFGTDHIYGVDPFNEIDSPSWDPETLAEMSRSIFGSMTSADPDAVWLQMGWLFYADPTHWTDENIRAYLTAVPQGRMILLDYYCEFIQIWKQTESFYGQPYIWCYLGNFGGNTMISGNFRTVSERITETFSNGQPNVYGIGSTLEGFGVNQFMYEYVLGRAWKTGLSDQEWISRLADRRVGAVDDAAKVAYKDLVDKIYLDYSITGQATLTSAHPCLEGNWMWTTRPGRSWSVADIMGVWEKFMKINSNEDSYLYDLVNVGRQALGDLFLDLRDEFTKAYKAGNYALAEKKSAELLGLLDDMDRLMACHREFRLSSWLEPARKLAGDNKALADYYEHNAKVLISVWGDSSHLTDYASRSLSGFISSYYRARWEMFFNEVLNCMKTGKAFDQKAFDVKIYDFERSWPDSVLPAERTPEDAKAVSAELLKKYQNIL